MTMITKDDPASLELRRTEIDPAHRERHAGLRRDAQASHVWSGLLRRADLRHRKPLALRRTFASFLIEGGESLKYVQEQLGHHSPAFTLAVYGHLLPRGGRRAVDRLDDATFRNPDATAESGGSEQIHNFNTPDLPVSDLAL